MSEDNRPWSERARIATEAFFTGCQNEITGQQLRAKLAAVVGEPPTPNAFGPFVANLVRIGYIVRVTGLKVRMTGRENHGRLTPVYLI
jgi:hypothetical protein